MGWQITCNNQKNIYSSFKIVVISQIENRYVYTLSLTL